MSKLITAQGFANSLPETKIIHHFVVDEWREIKFVARYTMINSGVYEEAQFTMQVHCSDDDCAVDAIKKNMVSAWIKSRIQVEIS